jgi:hypothetical protein
MADPIQLGKGPAPKPAAPIKTFDKYRVTELGQKVLSKKPALSPTPTIEEVESGQPYGIPPEWQADYRNQELGPNGQPQIPGQDGWDFHGRAYFGPGIGGYLKGVAARLTRPIEETPSLEEIPAFKQPERGPFSFVPAFSGLAFIAENIPSIMKSADILSRRASNLGREPGTEVTGDLGDIVASIPTFAGRGASELLRGGLSLLQSAAIGFKQYVGGTALALEAVAGTRPDREPQEAVFFQDGRAQGIEEAMRNLYLPNLSPVGMAVNAFRAGLVVGEGERPLEEYADIAKANFEAGRILYTTAIDPLAQQEFIRQVQDRSDPDLLAMELENPIAEAIGETLFDPLNFIGAGAGLRKANAGRRINSVSKEFIDIEYKAVEEALDGLSGLSQRTFVVSPSGEATVMGAVDDLVQARVAANQTTATRFADWAQDTGAIALTTDGKRFNVGRRAEEFFAWIAHNTNGPEETLEITRGLQLAASEDPAKVALGMDILNNFKVPRAMQSRAANELGYILNKVIDDNPQKFLDDLATAAKDGNVADMVELADKRMNPVIDEMFPTIAERVEAGEDIGFFTRGLARFDTVV